MRPKNKKGKKRTFSEDDTSGAKSEDEEWKPRKAKKKTGMKPISERFESTKHD